MAHDGPTRNKAGWALRAVWLWILRVIALAHIWETFRQGAAAGLAIPLDLLALGLFDASSRLSVMTQALTERKTDNQADHRDGRGGAKGDLQAPQIISGGGGDVNERFIVPQDGQGKIPPKRAVSQ